MFESSTAAGKRGVQRGGTVDGRVRADTPQRGGGRQGAGRPSPDVQSLLDRPMEA